MRSAAVRSRQLSIQTPKRGTTRPSISERMIITTSSSSSVTPSADAEHLTGSLPAFDVGILSVPAWRTVSAVADDVGLVAVIPGEFVDVRAAPRFERNLLGQIRTVPVVGSRRSHAQRLQTLVGGRERPRIELVGGEGRLEGIDLGLGGRDLGLRHVLKQP